MDWGNIALSLLVMAGAYFLGYISSFFLSKNYATKKKDKEGETSEKQK